MGKYNDYKDMTVTEDNFKLISKAELKSEVFLNISLST
jgi:hypothetical protein